LLDAWHRFSEVPCVPSTTNWTTLLNSYLCRYISLHTADAAEARQWLKQLQSYILQLSKQVTDAAAGDAQQCEASSTTSSMDEAMGSSNCSMAGTAACDTAWRMLCQDAADVLGRLGDQLSGGAASSVSSCYCYCCCARCKVLKWQCCCEQALLCVAQFVLLCVGVCRASGDPVMWVTLYAIAPLCLETATYAYSQHMRMFVLLLACRTLTVLVLQALHLVAAAD
jgi:hypothetical protein